MNKTKAVSLSSDLILLFVYWSVADTLNTVLHADMPFAFEFKIGINVVYGDKCNSFDVFVNNAYLYSFLLVDANSGHK